MPLFKNFVVLAVLTTIVMGGFASPVLAAKDTGFNLTTSPLPIDLTVLPGKTVSSVLRVQNSGTRSIQVRVDLMKFSADSKTGKLTISKQDSGDDYFDWVTFSENSFTAEPGVWNNIAMTIKVPPSGAFGYYYAVVFSQVTQSSLSNTPSAQIRGGVATLVLLDVNAPGEKRQLSVASFSADKKIYEYLPVNFSIKVTNTGNTHVVPSGDIYISKGGSADLAVLKINSTVGSVLPGSVRIFQTNWSDGFPVYVTKVVNGQAVVDTSGTPLTKLTWRLSDINKIRIGHYRAHMLLSYNDGSGNKFIEGDVLFWVIPWKILIAAFLVLALIGVGLWSSLKPVRKLVRTRISKSKKSK